MRLQWDDHVNDQGIDQGVLYTDEGAYPWNGLQSVIEKASGASQAPIYIDGVPIISITEATDFVATISAFMYPDAFSEYDGYSESSRYKRFGLSYRTPKIDGYQIHLVYNALASPADLVRSTNVDSVDLSTFVWDISASPVTGFSFKPSAHLIIDSDCYLGLIDQIEALIYGTDVSDPQLPDPMVLAEVFESEATMRMTQNGDGQYVANGPDSMVVDNGDGTFTIRSETAFDLKDGGIVVNSY